ncbi:MAG: TRAP transporter substrate-binding protein DctP [Gammaproteobacteria bacterium]|nr:TRAP transporter substrate-binding protein DctP [Gammaproteobacteria bacterium]
MTIRTGLLRLLLGATLVLATSTASAIDMKIATIAPDGTLWMQEMRKGAEDIARRTDGRVNFKFYPGGSMGSDRSVLRKIRAGQLHGGALTGGALSDIYPDSQLYNLPYLFRSYDELDYVRTRLDRTIAQGIENHGFVTFGFSDGGFAYIMSNVPVRRVDELKAQKVWVPEGDDITRLTLETVGVSPTPMAITDVLTGLQTGLISTVGTSPVGAIALQWHTKIKYVTDVPGMYLYGTLAIDKKAFGRLTPADQTVVRSVMEKIFVSMNHQTRIDDANARDALRKQGIEFVAMPPEDLARMRTAAEQTIDRLAKQGTVTPALLKTLRGHLDTYRRQHPAASR